MSIPVTPIVRPVGGIPPNAPVCLAVAVQRAATMVGSAHDLPVAAALRSIYYWATLSRRLSVVVLWRTQSLRCVLVTTGDPIAYEIQVHRDGVPLVQQVCTGSEDVAQLSALLWRRFATH